MRIVGKKELTWQDDFTARVDSTGKWTGSWGFHCYAPDVTKLAPKLGASCIKEGYRHLKVSGFSVERIIGDRAEVMVEFGGFAENSPFTFDDAPDEKFVYDLAITLSDEPIETHFRYRELEKAEADCLRDYKMGKRSRVDDTYDFKDDDGNSFTVESELGIELADYILKGVESYLKPGQVWRVTYADKKLPPGSVLNKVGKIATSVKGAPSLSGDRDWLFAGISANSNNGIYTITHEYQMSGQGGWEEPIYGAS